ncbi:MAG TPA: DUF1847 domain-containing protein [Nitrospirota bacterium]|nr:DUF1847 domain-containing protein [Nitrospirota bacterium]
MLNCAKCGKYSCRKGDLGHLPKECPIHDNENIYDKAILQYREDPQQLAVRSARIEATGYGIWPRIREIIEFAKSTGYTKLGLAFCTGLRKEAMKINKIFENSGFTMSSVACKTGGRPKEELGIKNEEKVRPEGFEAMCNPAAQAMLLNKAKTELNILVGLCVGHDSLFIRNSEAPVTILAVKDRVTGHNPLAAIYASHYFESKLKN